MGRHIWVVIYAILLAVVSPIVEGETIFDQLYSIQKSTGLSAENLVETNVYRLSADNCAVMSNKAHDGGDNDIAIGWLRECLKLILKGEESTNSKDVVRKAMDYYTCEKVCLEVRGVRRNGRTMKCHMWDNHHDPWMILQPAKLEVLETDPYICLFHDIISDKEINDMISWVIGSDRTFRDPETKAKSVIMAGTENKQEKLMHRIAHAVGLYIDDVLDFSRHNTGAASSANHDPFVSTGGLKSSDYVATVMFHLSDVENGGETVFVDSGFSVIPLKGSALFWHKFHPPGDLDPETKYCDCKVDRGTMWKATGWLYRTNNEICTKTEEPDTFVSG